MKYYIAYGSNTPEEMENRCPESEYLGLAYLNAFRPLFAYHMTLQKHEGSRIKVMLYKISDGDEKRLDEYESCPTYYEKEYVDVEFEGNTIRALVYIMRNTYAGYLGMPDHDYFIRIALGYKKSGIPKTQLLDAVTFTANRILEGTVWRE